LDSSTPGKTHISRPEHNISRANISEHALKVLYRLKNSGFEACLVGGGVRDLLLERKPKDFDIATNATPEQVRKLFRNCRLIGRRFRLAHVHFPGAIIEVATYRGQHEGDQGDQGQIVNGMIVRDNVYGTLEEDAMRRDFTVNSLYYNIQDFSVVDFVGGLEDLKRKCLRLIGDPEQRYKEDPVRMLRAIRFAAKLDFTIEPASEEPISRLACLLEDVPPARLFEEVLKLLLAGKARKNFSLLRQYGLFQVLFPQTHQAFSDTEAPYFTSFLETALVNTDDRISENKSVTPAFLLAVFLWQPVRERKKRYLDRGMSPSQALLAAADYVISGQNQRVSLPRRFHTPIREIWNLQERLKTRAPKRSYALIKHPVFRAAYDFFLLRAQVGDESPEMAAWWTGFIDADDDARSQMLSSINEDKGKPRRKKRKPKAKSSSAVKNSENE